MTSRTKNTKLKEAVKEIRVGTNMVIRMGRDHDGDDFKDLIRDLAITPNPETGASLIYDVRRDLTRLHAHLETVIDKMLEPDIVRLAERASKRELPMERFEKLPEKDKAPVSQAVSALQNLYRMFNADDYGAEYESALLKARDSYLEKRKAVKKPALFDLVLALSGMPYEAKS